MYKILAFNLFMLFFVACSQKINNISNREEYKTLKEVTISVVNNIKIINIPSNEYNVYYVNWGHGFSPVFTLKSSSKTNDCKLKSDIYSDTILKHKIEFEDLFLKENISIKSFEKSEKRILELFLEKYDCKNEEMYIKVILKDIERNNYIIYQNIYYLENLNKTQFNKRKIELKLIEFYREIIEDLKTVMNMSEN